ncbi:hypothetical protein HAX54_045774, partial [Datura stramonium]|nr:hypothetical protein [Datura stramonium]
MMLVSLTRTTKLLSELRYCLRAIELLAELSSVIDYIIDPPKGLTCLRRSCSHLWSLKGTDRGYRLIGACQGLWGP